MARIITGRRQLLKGEQGQSMVELALVLPLLIMLLTGIIQFGFLFNGYITVTSAAREGARLAVVGGTDEQVKARVQNEASAPLLQVRDEDIVIQRPVTAVNQQLIVQVTGRVEMIVPLLDRATGDSMAVVSRSVMRVEIPVSE